MSERVSLTRSDNPTLCLERVERVGRRCMATTRDKARWCCAVWAKVELQKERLALWIPAAPEHALCPIHLLVGQFERNCLVRLGRKEEVLKLAVGRFNALLKGRHEAVARENALSNLRVVNLEQEAVGPGPRVLLLGH